MGKEELHEAIKIELENLERLSGEMNQLLRKSGNNFRGDDIRIKYMHMM